MYKFKGTINGVEYTDRKAFFEALKSTRNNGKYNVSIQEVRNDETGALKETPTTRRVIGPKYDEKPQVQTTNYDELFNKLGGFFISFLRAQNPALYNKLAAAAQENAEQEQRKQIPYRAPQRVESPLYPGSSAEFHRILEKYFFKDTTYIFTGGAEDAFHLDRFAGLLDSRSKEIVTEKINLNKAQKKVLYTRTLSEFARIQKQISSIEDSLLVTDRQLAGFERVISSYKDISFPIPENIQRAYDEQKHTFDILTNRKNYYQLLLEHYRTIGPYFDPEH